MLTEKFTISVVQLCFCLGTLYAASASSHPLVIDFNALPAQLFVTSFSSQGFNVADVPSGSSFASISSGGSSFCGPPCPNNGTNHLLNQGGGWRITESANTPFSLVSFDGAEAHAETEFLWAPSILVTGALFGGGTVSASFPLDFIQDGDGPANDFQTFLLPPTFADLLSVEFQGIGGQANGNWFSMDNVAIRSAVVPEPATEVLFATVIAAILGLRLRKQCCRNRNE